MAKVAKYSTTNDMFSIMCPACGIKHTFKEGIWSWNRDFETPTISPSLLVTAPPSPLRCHSFVRDGKIQFLGDCNHDMAGKTVELPQITA